MCAMSPRLLRPVASGFSPKSIAGLAAWYDATVASSVTLTNGFVSQWSDLSGGGFHLSQATEADRPGTATIGGKTAIDFDGSNDFLFTSSTLPNFGTVFDVHLLDNGTAAHTLYTLNASVGGTAKRMGLLYVGSVNEYRSQSVFGATVQGVSGGIRTANARVTAFTFNESATVGRVDGAALAGTTATTTSSDTGLYLGIRSIGGALSLPLNGKIGEFIVYNRVLTLAEIQKVEKYLAAKFGVTLA
jgi:hypothetical protein